MSCLHPRKIRNKKYLDKSFSDIWRYSLRVYGTVLPPNRIISVPCGRCIECLKRRLFGFRMRLLYELNKYPNSIFVTLTFDEKNLKRFSDNPNKSISLFLDRLRKTYGSNIRHWFVAEYGSKRGRMHYHGILFDCQIDNEQLSKLWKYGLTYVGYANAVTAKYIVKYLTKSDTKTKTEPPRIVSSKGIGISFLETPQAKIMKAKLSTSLPYGSYIVPLPRYYIDKLFTEREKEIISYYNYMENLPEYFVRGVRYSNEDEANEARLEIYRNYCFLGLVMNDVYIKRPRISSFDRYKINLESYLKFNFNYYYE